MKVGILVLALVAAVHADMYLHNPRGSNNRLDEANRDRNNANRLFDSQNNNRGGYNVGSLYYYSGSILPIEWTNQHSCGDPNNKCEIILQYMCDENVRDGASTKTIPDNPAQCENYDCNTDFEFGMHESFDYYVECRLRQRNMGLFTADRNVNGQNARYTRQNNNGNRRGYECPEERDYYPYWHPTPWRDIAIFTNNVTHCVYYQEESANVKARYACVLPTETIQANVNNRGSNYIIPNNEAECRAEGGTWTEFPPDPRLSAPECVESLWSRDNHLGNTVGGFTQVYNWTIPDLPHEHCVLRIRYNISTVEFNGWDPAVSSQIERLQGNDAKLYRDTSNQVDQNVPISELDVYSQFGFDFATAKARGYVFRQNPVVKLFEDVVPNSGERNFGLQLAINTNQFGRTFQDRTHTFAIRTLPDDMAENCTLIYNLNVRGKRGNIVQVYPGVEYDFVPNRLEMAVDDCVHIQWTGSNTNPNNNDGQGRAGTDRSNIVLLTSQNYPEGDPAVGVPEDQKFGHWGNSYPAHLTDNNNKTFLGLDEVSRQNLALLTPGQFGGEMSELDDAGTYFDLGPKKITQRGYYYYLSTRNNNFTNRSQKGLISVLLNRAFTKRIGWNGGTVENGGTSVIFDRGTLTQPVTVRLEVYPNSSYALDIIREEAGYGISEPGSAVSKYFRVDPTNEFHTDSGNAQIQIPLEDGTATNYKVYRASAASAWQYEELDTTTVDGMATASTSTGGVFVVASPVVTAWIVASVVVVILLLVLFVVGGVTVYFIVRREKWHATKDKVKSGMKNVSRSFANKV